VSASKKREIEKEDAVGLEKVAVASKKIQNDDPLPFLKKPYSNFKFGSGSATQVTQQARKRGQLVQWTRYFSERSEKRLILTLVFFSISTSFP
jgi:hypothetical protein